MQLKVKILITFGISNRQSPAKQMTSFVALAVKEPTVRNCKQESMQPHSALTKGRERGTSLVQWPWCSHFFSSIKHVLIPLQNSLEMRKNMFRKLGLGNHCTWAGGMVTFLNLSFVSIKDIWRLHWAFSWSLKAIFEVLVGCIFQNRSYIHNSSQEKNNSCTPVLPSLHSTACWVRWGLDKGSVPEGGGHGTGSEWLELKERLDTTLINRVWVVLGGAKGWNRGSLWVPCNSGTQDSMNNSCKYSYSF